MTIKYEETTFTTPPSILLEAEKIVNGARASDYGPKQSFGKIARVASELTTKELTAKDIIIVLLAVKLVRESYKHKRDNLVDLAGYSKLLNDIEEL